MTVTSYWLFGFFSISTIASKVVRSVLYARGAVIASNEQATEIIFA